MLGRVCLLFILSASVLAYDPTEYLWPRPQQVECNQDVFYELDEETFDFAGFGPGGELGPLTLAFERYRKVIFDSPLIAKRNTDATKLADGELRVLSVEVTSSDETLGLETDESCEWLLVTPSNHYVPTECRYSGDQ